MSGCSVNEYLDFLGCHLKDKDHVRWTEEYLLCVIKIAASQVADDFSSDFTEEKKLKLTPGCKTQTCAQGCVDVSGPFFNEANNCGRIEETDIESDWTSKYFTDINCSDENEDDQYRVEKVEFDPSDSCTIFVDPPVPDDGNAYFIYARCDKDINNEIDGGNLPSGVCKRLNGFTQLVLFYVYGMDSMVNLDQTQSQTYFNNYLNLVGLVLSAEERAQRLEQFNESVRVGVT